MPSSFSTLTNARRRISRAESRDVGSRTGFAAGVPRRFSVDTKTWQAFRNAPGVFGSPTPITNSPASRIRVARRV